MHIIEVQINKFLKEVQSKPYKIPLDLLDKFGAETKDALRKQFERESKNFTLRMSNLGMPSCILQMERVHGSSNTHIIRNLLGDLVEDLVLFLLHASGIKVLSELEPVILSIAGTKIHGTLDVVLDLGEGPELYDIKSASEYSFTHKFKEGGFQALAASDSFGYISQLFGYAEAKSQKDGVYVRPAGWIIANKSTGEILVLEVPKEHDKYKKHSFSVMVDNINVISNNLPFQKKFSDLEERFQKKLTGNRILGTACSFCSFKNICWPNIKTLPQIPSTSKSPRILDYTYINE